jgi:hypothetical protein
MKIKDILGENIETKKIPGYFNFDQLQRRKLDRLDKDDEIKSGADAHIRRQEPDTVSKILYMPIRDPSVDANYTFLYTIAVKNLDESNTYFPKVKKIVNIKDKMGYIIPKFVIEKLYQAEDFDPKDLYNLGNQLFTNFQYRLPKKDISNLNPYDLNDAFSKSIKAVYRKTGVQEALDPQFEQALEIIRDIIDSNQNLGFVFDMHARNFLFRPVSGSIPQLVITDPISADTYFIKKRP